MTTPPTPTHDPNRLMDAQEERERQARIECLIALRHAALMQVGAYERELAALGRVFKKKEENQ